MRLRARGEGARLFMPHGYPLDVLPPSDLLENAVERIPHHPEYPFDPCRNKRFDKIFRDAFLCHGLTCFRSRNLPGFRICRSSLRPQAVVGHRFLLIILSNK